MSWDKYERAAERGPGALLWVCVPWIIGLFILVGSVSFLTFVFNPFTQAARIVNKTIDADNVIYNYEWFKSRHEDIKGLDRKIVESQLVVDQFVESAGERKDWDREDKTEHSRLTSVVLGLKQQRSDLVSEYNAKSRMVNRNIFKTGDVELPERIEL